jgi:O-antigen/teichoic acid export membrane protein
VSLRAKLGVSVAIQAAGSMATLFATMVVSRNYGAEAQGYISYFRSVIEFVVSIGLFGLPQAFVYLVNARRITLRWALHFSARYSALCAIIISACAIAAFAFGTANGFDGWATLAGALAASGLLGHGLFRALTLPAASTKIFNLVSIAPSVLLLVFYVAAHPTDYHWLVFGSSFAGLFGLLISLTAFKGVHWNGVVPNDQRNPGVFSAFRYGFWSFVPHVTLALTTVGTYALLRHGSPAGDTAVGYFSVAVLLVSSAVLPLNMVIPVLFNSWASENEQHLRRSSFSKLAQLGAVASAIGLLVGVFLAPTIISLFFGAEFAPSVLITQIMLVGIYAHFHGKLSSALLLAIGKPQLVALAAALKTLTIFVMLAAGTDGSLLLAAIAWTAAEFVSSTYMAIQVITATQWPIMSTLGLSRDVLARRLPSQTL